MLGWGAALVAASSLLAAESTGLGLVRHAPTLNGHVDGTLQLLTGEAVTLNSGAIVSQDLLVPGTPAVRLNGTPVYQGTVDGTGATTPSNYQITLNGGASLRHIVRRTNPVALPAIGAPPTPTGTRTVVINSAGQSPGSYATLRHLTLNGNVGQFAIPAGTYGDFTANGGSGFTLGVAGATQPSVYHFQHLTLNGQTQLQVIGPVQITVASGFTGNGTMGSSAHSVWLTLNLYSGGFTLNGGCSVYGTVNAPNGTVIINGGSQLIGGLACDQLLLNSGGLLRLSLAGGNRAPVAAAQSVALNEDTAAAILLTASDADGDALSYAITTAPAHGTLAGTAPNLTYTPAADYHGADSFAFKVNDGQADSAPATVTLAITPINDRPVAVAKSATLNEDTPLNVFLSGTDADGDALTFAVTTAPAHGTLSGTAPNLIYTPALNYHGADSFTYTATDGSLTSVPATFALTVTAVNDPPVASAASYAVNEGATLAIVLAAADVDGDPLAYTVLTAPTHGTLTGTPPNLSYQPAANFSGVDSFTFRASDGAANSAPATITVQVSNLNDPPFAASQSVTTAEDTPKPIALAGSDPDGDAITFVIVTPPEHGALAGIAPNLTYTPAADYAGADSFTFRTHDTSSVDSNLATVAITVTPVNDAPVAADQTLATDEDTALAIQLAATDVDTASLTYAVVTAPQHGTLTGTAPNLIYTPAANYHGPDSFTFQANDAQLDSAVATIALTIGPVNDGPVATAQTLAATEDTPLPLTLAGTDVENAPLTFAIATPPQHGTLAGTAPDLTYAPAPDYHGGDSFTFTVNDGELESAPATVTLDVAAVNDAPGATGQTVALPQDTSTTITLAATDLDGDALTYTIVTAPGHGTLTGSLPNLTYTPAAGYRGADSLVFTASDGQLTSNQATIDFSVTPVNHAPTIAAQDLTLAEDATADVILGATDPDGDPISYLITASPQHGTLSGTAPHLVYTPAADYHGTDAFTVVVTDGALSSAPVTIGFTIQSVNDAPMAAAQSLTLAEDASLPVTLTATDVDNDPLSYAVLTPPQHGVLTGTAPALVYTPAANYSGPDSFTFKASDGALESGVATVSLTVTPVNDAPVAMAQNLSVISGEAAAIVLAATDLDGDVLSYALVTPPAHGTVTGTAPNLTYTPNSGYVGADSFTFTANDGLIDSAAAEVTVTVSAPANAAPQVNAGADQTVSLRSSFGGGKIVVNGDDWTLSSTSLNDANNSARRYAVNIADWFTGGRPGRFLVYSSSFGLTSAELATVMTAAGHTWTVTLAGPFTLETLRGYDGVFLLGTPADNQTLIEYVRAGGNVYVGAGGGGTDGEQWKTFLTAFGLRFGVYSATIANVSTVGATHPLFQGTNQLFYYNPNIVERLNGSDPATAIVLARNGEPLVGVYSPSTTSLFLQGAVSDDGQPAGSVLTSMWTSVSGPAPAVIAQPATPVTGVQFSAPGDYVFRLTATDGALTSTDDVRWSLVTNEPPVIATRPAVVASVGTSVPLEATVSDDGSPVGGRLTSIWTQVEGPGAAVFVDPAQVSTSVTFPVAGIYTLKLSVGDGLETSEAFVEARVAAPSPLLPTARLAAWWKANGSPLEEIGGGRAFLLDGAGYASGMVSQAFNFDGVDDSVEFLATPATNLASGSGFTIELWVRPEDGRDARLLTWHDGQLRGASLQIIDGGRLRFYLAGGTFVQSAQLMQSGTWQHVAVTYDAATGRVALYRDGVRLTNDVIGIAPRTIGNLHFGAEPLESRFHFAGRMDEVALYSRALEPQEMFAIYQSGGLGRAPLEAGHLFSVKAGAAGYVRSLAEFATLDGTVVDSPATGLPVFVQWTKIEGPGAVDFAAPGSLQTTARFSAPGLYLLGLAATNGLASASDLVEVRVASLLTLEGPPDMAAWWPGNGTTVERVARHDTSLLNGAGFASGIVAQGYAFDGVNDLATAPAHVDLDVGQAAGFTVELWFKPNDVRDTPLLIWHDGQRSGCSILIRDGGRYAADFIDTTGRDMLVQSNQITQVGVWQHVAISYDKSTGFGRVYKNGVLVAATQLGNFTPQTAWDVWIGGQPNSSNRYFNGVIDEPAIYRRALRADEIAALYATGALGKSPDPANRRPVVSAGADIALAGPTAGQSLAGFAADDGRGMPLAIRWTKVDGPDTVTIADFGQAATTATFGSSGLYTLRLAADDGVLQSVDHVDIRVGLPTSASPAPTGLVAWWRGNNEPLESVQEIYNVDLRNGATYAPGMVGSGFRFDGIDDQAKIATYSNLDIGASTLGFTIEFWVKPTVVTYGPLLHFHNGTTDGLHFWTNSDTNRLTGYLMGTGGGVVDGPGAAIQAGVWQHVALVYDKTAGVARLYKNGNVVGTANIGTGYRARTDYDLYFGANPVNPQRFNGTLDEISLYNRPLSTAELAAIYAAGAAGKELAPVNLAPVVNAGADATGYVGAAVGLSGTATDDGLPNPPATLTYTWSKLSGPGNMVFSAPGALSTTATFDAAGSYTLRLTASDSMLSTSDDVVVTVTAPPSQPPTVAFYEPANHANLPASTYFELAIHASDPDGTLTKVEFFQGGTKLGEQTLPVVGDPTTYFWPMTGGLTAGDYTFTAKATDNSGVSTVSASLTLTVIADPGPPSAAISLPAEDSRITAPTEVTGVVASSILDRWSLDYRLKVAEGATPEDWINLASGSTAVGSPAAGTTAAVAGPLGTFDPTRLINGLYELQLTATDTAGRTVTDGPIAVVVEGNMKIGAFTLAFEDLKVPVAGLPITLTRTYDSRDPRVGDFGPGWRLALANIRVQKNRNLGAGWWQTPQQGSGIQFYDVLPIQDRIVTIVFPDGETHRFKAGAYVKVRPGDPDYRSFAVVVQVGKYRFYPIGDTTSKLEPVDAAGQLAEDFWIDGTGDQDLRSEDPASDPFAPTFNPTRYRLTTKDGAVYLLDETAGLLRLTDLNGNTLVPTRDAQNRLTGVTSTQNAPDGPITTAVVIHRDATGRVDYIRDPANHELDYAYDAQGRLTSFTDRELNTTQFRYENAAFPHHLTKVLDPRGVAALRSEFDATGRLVKQTDADGLETVFSRGADATGRFEKIKDRLGHETTFYYDDRGNVTLKIDPLGAQTSYSYYPDGDWVKFEIDHYGNVKSFAYDAHGNPTVETIGASATEDPANPTTGYTTRTSYNDLSAPTQITDPDGRVQSFTYDAATNNLLTHTAGSSAPATTVYTYKADGTPATITDALGNVTSHAYDYGFSDAAYPSAVKQITVTITDPASAAGSDPANIVATVLRSTRMLYDAQENQLAQIVARTLPDGSTEDVITRYRYDSENRLVATIQPDGKVTETRYNAIGKEDRVVLWSSLADYQAHDDAVGRATVYGYDDRGNQTSLTYADGTSETMHFDAENRKDWSEDRKGQRTTFAYDDVGRLRFTTHPGATSPQTETVYDLIGRVTHQIDELGHDTEFSYENNCGCAMRRREMVQHLASGDLVTNYEYDRAGNIRFVADPRGNTVETRYDDQGRPTLVIYPATDENPATQTATSYDALGRRIETVDQDGKVTRYRYDALGRLTGVTQFLAHSSAGVPDTSDASKVLVTSYTYDELGGQQTQTDALGRTTTYWTDTVGRRTKRILPKDASESASFTETLSYDAWGNLSTRTDFAGKTTTYAYDALNRLTSKTADATHPSLAYSHATARVEYDYDANGARQAARTYNAAHVLLYSETTPRDERGRVDYKDAPLGRLDYDYYDNGLLKDTVSSNANGVNLGYRYDEANRLAYVDDTSTGLPVRTTSYTYNPNGSLESVTYPNAVAHAYTYDTLNRLRTLNVTAGVATVHSYDYKLKPSGHRWQVTEGAKTTTYTYDDLHRLTGETVASDPHGNNGTVTYSLDAVGNRLNRVSSIATLTSQLNQSYNARDWLSGDTYTANGSTVTGHLSPLAPGLSPETSGTDVYDFEEHLILRTKPDGSSINVSYDADGNRVQKTLFDASAALTSTTTWLVDTNNLTGYAQAVEERTTTGGTTSVSSVSIYTYGSDLISRATSLNTQPSVFSYYAYDGHGSVRELTDASGTVTDRYDYDAFGSLIFRSGSTVNAYLYCGEQYDADLGLYYNRARYLNADAGRFWIMDRWQGRASNPVTLNRFLYADGDPVDGIDPSGYFTLGELQLVQNVRARLDKMAIPNVRVVGNKVARKLVCAGANTAARWAHTHHTLTNKGTGVMNPVKGKIDDLFKQFGADSNSWFNKLLLPNHKTWHAGGVGHPAAYHQQALDFVRNELMTSLGTLDPSMLAGELAEEVIMEKFQDAFLKLAARLCDSNDPLTKLVTL